MKRIILIAAATSCLSATWTVSAVGEWRYMEPAIPEAVSAPVNYMTMAAVSAKFGEPENQAPPVGQPPITRWYYPRYTVYFEHDRVIISVFN